MNKVQLMGNLARDPKAAKAAAPGESFEDMGNAADDEEIPF